jgi:hypothetical protein
MKAFKGKPVYAYHVPEKSMSIGDATSLYGACRLTRIYQLATELNMSGK